MCVWLVSRSSSPLNKLIFSLRSTFIPSLALCTSLFDGSSCSSGAGLLHFFQLAVSLVIENNNIVHLPPLCCERAKWTKLFSGHELHYFTACLGDLLLHHSEPLAILPRKHLTSGERIKEKFEIAFLLCSFAWALGVQKRRRVRYVVIFYSSATLSYAHCTL